MYEILGIQCSKCNEEIFSLSRHDWHPCHCKATFVDGGAAYLRVGGYPVLDEEGKLVVIKRPSPLPQTA